MMKTWLTGFCALALGASILTGCSESPNDRVGDRPRERTPSASPPTTPPPARTPDTTTPPPPSSPTTQPSSGTGTK